MENEEKLLTSEESLKIITEMINKTKVNVRQGVFHLLFWGWLIFVCSLTEYLLWRFSDFTHPYYVWFFVIPGILVSMIYGFTNGRKRRVSTYADMLYMWTWFAFFFASLVLFIIQRHDLGAVGPYIFVLAGTPTFISGFIIRFRPLIAGGISFWIIALIITYTGPSVGHLAMPVAMITGYLIPGYMLKNKVKNGTI